MWWAPGQILPWPADSFRSMKHVQSIPVKAKTDLQISIFHESCHCRNTNSSNSWALWFSSNTLRSRKQKRFQVWLQDLQNNVHNQTSLLFKDIPTSCCTEKSVQTLPRFRCLDRTVVPIQFLSLLANLLSERAERERHASTHHLGLHTMEFQSPCLILNSQLKWNMHRQLKKRDCEYVCSWVKWVNAYKCLLHAFQLPASLPKQNSLCSPRCESTSNGIANCHWDQVLHQNVTPTQRCTFEKSWFVRIARQISRAALSQQKSLSICSGSKSYAVLFEKWLAWEQSGWEDEHVRHWVLEADGNEHGDREPNSNHLAGEVLIHQLDLAFQLLTDVTMALPLHGCNWTILNSSNSPTYDVCPSPWCTTTRPCKPANCTWYPSPHHGFPVTTNPSKLCEEQVQASAYLTYPDLTRKVPLN